MTTAFLKWKSPDGGEQVYPLYAEEVLIGRKSDADIILANPYVSRHHAKLIKDKGGYSIVALESTQGTFVNRKRVRRQELSHGDRIRLGRTHIELRYCTEETDSARPFFSSEEQELEKTLIHLTSILPSEASGYSDLEKLSSLLDFQYQWGRMFSAERALEQILHSALNISGAERGYILLRQQNKFTFAIGKDRLGQKLPQEDFRASQSVVRSVKNDGKPIFMAAGIEGEFAQLKSIQDLGLRSLACMPLRWLSPESEEPEVRGVLYLDSTRTMHTLSGLDEKILSKLAVEASSVFEKLEIIKTFDERKSLKLELEMVHNELRAADQLRRAEAQILLSEYAASIGRFAAALSHELNSPLAVLKTSLQTSQALARKMPDLTLEKKAEVRDLEAHLLNVAIESVERLHGTILRMQRLTNLDRSEILAVDLNSLLQDVVDVLKPGIKDNVVIDLNFQPLPLIKVRPLQLNAVFSNLLHNAVEGLQEGGHIVLATSEVHPQLEIVVQDDGKGISAEELAGIFDPAFKVKRGRVSTGNWSLFSSRQIVREHGGEIEFQSSPGKGTTVRVTLPRNTPL